MLQKDAGVFAQGEEVVFLLQPIGCNGRVVRTPPAQQFIVRVVVIAIRAVPAGIRRLINVSIRLRTGKEFHRRPEMTLLCRSRPGIDGNIQRVPGAFECDLHPVSPLLWSETVGRRRPDNVLAIFIQTHAKSGVIANRAVVTRDHIRRYFFERVPNMRLSIRIVDRGRNVKRRCCFVSHSSLPRVEFLSPRRV